MESAPVNVRELLRHDKDRGRIGHDIPIVGVDIPIVGKNIFFFNPLHIRSLHSLTTKFRLVPYLNQHLRSCSGQSEEA
ncbi:hypothetical protein V6N13_133659 [Hibiscus sabdariffa]